MLPTTIIKQTKKTNSITLLAGFDLAGDLKHLGQHFPDFQKYTGAYYDLNLTRDHLETVAPWYKYPGSNDTGLTPSLTNFVMLMFGCPLDKRETLSWWGRPELREAQMLYAAIDAHCVLAIFNKLRNDLGEDIFGELIGKSMQT